MRTLGPALFAFALAACGQSTAPPAEPESQPEAVAPAPSALSGDFVAISTTAMSLTGDLNASADVLSFGKGFRLEGGRIDTMLAATTDLSAGGGTIADGSGNTSIQTIELRRIDNQRIAADAADPRLCGEGKAPTHVILANGAETLSVLVFSGADAPGPNAHDTQLCGIFNYQPR